MRRKFNFRLLPILFGGAILAICAVTFCGKTLQIVAAVAAGIFMTAAVLIKEFKKARMRIILTVLVFLITMGWTALNFDVAEGRKVYSQHSLIEASVDIMSECDSRGNLELDENTYAVYLYDVEIDGVKAEGKAQAVFTDMSVLQGLKIGDRIRFEGSISPVILTVTDGSSMHKYSSRVYHYIISPSASEDYAGVSFLSHDIKTTDKIKLAVKDKLYGNVRSDTAGFLYAMTFGDKTGLDTQIKNAFSYTGTAHVFAVSGLHAGIIASAILFVLKRLKLYNIYIKTFAVSAALLPFCALCGFSASTVRATVMILVAMTAKIFKMRNDSLSTLSLAGLLILTLDPLNLFDVGFVMSFAAIVGIIMTARPIERILGKIKKFPKKLASGLAMTVGANAALMPIMVYCFGGQTLLFVLANMIILPIISIIFPVYLISTVLAFIPYLGVLLTLVGAPFTLVIKTVSAISGIDTLVIDFSSSWIIILICLIAIVLLSEYVFVNKKFKAVTASVIALSMLLTMSFSARRAGDAAAQIFCYEDIYGCQYMLVDNTDGGDYLIVNGKLSSDSVSAARKAMEDRRFKSVDGIIVVGDKVDGGALLRLASATNCREIFSFGEHDYLQIGFVARNHIVDGALIFGYDGRGSAELCIGANSVRILADGYILHENDFDVLLTYAFAGDMEEGQYCVCSDASGKYYKNYMPSTFTFKIKNDKLVTNVFGRY